MKKMSCVLAILFAWCTALFAQSSVNGTWRLDGVGPPFPWEVVLRVDEPRLTGMVNSCTSYPVDIYDGHIKGNTVTFKCKSGAGGDRDRTITFTGTVNGDEIAFTWQMQVRDGGFPPNAFNAKIFDPSGPHQFIAKRVPDGKLAEENQKAVRGMELAAAVNLLEKDVKVDGMLFVPQKVSRVRAVIVTPYCRLVLNQIPALVFDTRREPGAMDATKDFWMSGRSAGAPWTCALEPNAVHGDPKDMSKANDLLIPWITAVLRERLSRDGKTLRPVTDGAAWLGNNRTGQGGPYATFSGSKADASWIPDQATARGWRVVTRLEAAK